MNKRKGAELKRYIQSHREGCIFCYYSLAYINQTLELFFFYPSSYVVDVAFVDAENNYNRHFYQQLYGP